MMMVLILNERRTFISILEKVGVDLRSQKKRSCNAKCCFCFYYWGSFSFDPGFIPLESVSLSFPDDSKDGQRYKYNPCRTTDQGSHNASVHLRFFTPFTGEVRRLAGCTPEKEQTEFL